MSWQTALINVYDTCKKSIDYEHNNGTGLCPIAHTPLSVHIDVYINESEEFVRASRIGDDVDENGRKHPVKIFAPADEKASARSSKPEPKGLSDDLRYMAGDFADCFPKDKKAGKSAEAFELYMMQMHDWIQFGAPKDISVLYRYLSRKTLAKDVLSCVEDASSDDILRFTVIHKDDSIVKGTWQNQEIAKSFARFCISRNTKTGIDVITGEEKKLAGLFSSQIRSGGDKAKLVSSNSIRKSDDFTFLYEAVRNPESCVTIGYEEAQKMTNALRYLISRQGIINGTERIVCFSSGSSTVPDLLNQLFPDDIENASEKPYTAEEYAERVRKAVNGYRKNIQTDEKIIIIGVDSAEGADKGRLAITKYYDMNQDQFFESIEKWYETCCWRAGNRIFTPSPYRIACAAYGIEQGSRLVPKDIRIRQTKNAVMKCTLENGKLSEQIISDIMKAVGNPQKYEEKNWRNIISTALAVLNRYFYDYKGEKIKMSLEKEKTDRSYQFGRLLAVAERIEDTAVYQKTNGGEGSHKTTNAVKNWNAFIIKPASTFGKIYQKIMPYMTKLSDGTQFYYKNLFGEIIEKIEKAGGFNDDKLKYSYLAGYYLQRDAMIQEAKAKKEEKENNEEKGEE